MKNRLLAILVAFGVLLPQAGTADEFKGRDAAMFSIATIDVLLLATNIFQALAVKPIATSSSIPAYPIDEDDPRLELFNKYLDLMPSSDSDIRGIRHYGMQYLLEHLNAEPTTVLMRSLQAELQRELVPSFNAMQGNIKAEIGLHLDYLYADSPSTQTLQVQAITNPLLSGLEGRFYEEGSNAFFEPDLKLSIGNWLHYKIRPLLMLSTEEVAYQDDYKFRIHTNAIILQLNRLQLEVGRDNVHWGIGRHGNLGFSNNSDPLDLIRLNNSEPLTLPGFLKGLGPTRFEIFATQLDDEQSPANPYIIATKFSCKPTAPLELGFGYIVEYGGDGAPSNNPLLFFGDFVSDASNPANRSFLIDIRYRFQSFQLEPYAEFLVEDCCDEVIFNGRDIQNLFGLYFPAIDNEGKVDLTLEWVRTNQITYRHGTFVSGFSYRSQLMGHALGPDATGIYADMRYWFHPGLTLTAQSALEIRGRRGVTISDEPITTVYPDYEVPEIRYRFMPSLRYQLGIGKSLWSQLDLGYEHVSGFNFESGRERDNFIVRTSLQSYF